LVAIEPHSKPLSKTIKIQLFSRTKEFQREGELFEIGAECSHGFNAGGQGKESAGHLDAPNLLPCGGLVEDGCRNLVACQGLLDVPGSGIGEEIELESEVCIIDRGGPCHILDSRGKSHGVLCFDELFCQFSEFFLAWNRCFSFHESIADEIYSRTDARELQPERCTGFTNKSIGSRLFP